MPLSLPLFLLPVTLWAWSYEGFINDAPIWIDLDIPAQNGTVTGSYFYKRVGTPLELTGTREEGSIQLREKDPKGRVTGTFEFGWSDDTDYLEGQWSKPSWGNAYESFRLWRADPANRRFAIHPFAGLSTGDGRTMQQVIAKSFAASGENRPIPRISYDRKNILSIGVRFSRGKDYRYPGWSYYVFDLTRKRSLLVLDEMDAKGKARLWAIVKPLLESRLAYERSRYPDSVWNEMMA